MEDAPPDFGSSILGTQEYWDDAYEKELENFDEIGDVGEIWFGEDTQDRMVKWMCKSSVAKSSKIIDLGCGNGMLLLALRQEDFTDLTGVDYSDFSIKLAKKVCEAENVKDINFEVCDILSSSDAEKHKGTYDICLDKGTYDAISLKNTEDPTDRQIYVKHVSTLLKPNGRLIITSCNWTKDELMQHFCKAFQHTDEIPAPKFTFGGQTGQKVTSLIFTRKD